MIKKIISQNISGGCFTLAVDNQRFIFRIFEWLVNLRARYFKVFDGDLGLLIRRDIFKKLGGFDEGKVMEDILFSKKFRKLKKTVVLCEKIHVSSRIWSEEGFVNTFLRYSQAYIQFFWSELFIKNPSPVPEVG